MNGKRGESSRERSQEGTKNEFERMQDRVSRKSRKRQAKKRIDRLIKFRNALVEEYEKLNEDGGIDEYDDNFDYSTLDDQQLDKAFKKQLDNQILEIFLRSDLFEQFHENVMMIRETNKIKHKSKEYAQRQTIDIEDKVRLQIE